MRCDWKKYCQFLPSFCVSLCFASMLVFNSKLTHRLTNATNFIAIFSFFFFFFDKLTRWKDAGTEMETECQCDENLSVRGWTITCSSVRFYLFALAVKNVQLVRPNPLPHDLIHAAPIKLSRDINLPLVCIYVIANVAFKSDWRAIPRYFFQFVTPMTANVWRSMFSWTESFHDQRKQCFNCDERLSLTMHVHVKDSWSVNYNNGFMKFSILRLLILKNGFFFCM